VSQEATMPVTVNNPAPKANCFITSLRLLGLLILFWLMVIFLQAKRSFYNINRSSCYFFVILYIQNKSQFMNKILMLGLGKVGSLVGVLLNKNFEVTGLDKEKPHYRYKLPFKTLTGDVSNIEFMRKTLGEYDAVVSALPYF